ncbi:MAG: ABC transporter ATP-binding protein [Gammaproteobacteria bacterium]|nr:MAG: ABC transporter ATP-binding protein [Gammaproteobacteria bacterium]
MIEFKDVSIRRDGRVLFEHATFQLHPQQNIGLTGNNGTGKSSLFAALLGELAADMGDIDIPSNWQKAHMAQEVASTNRKAIDYVLEGDAEWYALNQKINNPDSIADDEFAPLYQRFDEIDGYRTPSKAAQILAGLGFSTTQHEHVVGDFSGGWRMRLNLARTLMCRADVLLLDEPTNHLDLDAIIWLEEWITNFPGMVLLISHDQRFLDACVSHILHIENQTVTLYTGNYSQFVRTRSERMAQQQQAFEKQQAARAHMEDFVRRFRAKASKAKQAQSRIKQLERMADLSAVVVDNPFTFSFYAPDEAPHQMIVLEKAQLGYNDTVLLDDIRLEITSETRLGLLGMNGAGKSTLIKGLVGDLPLMSGKYSQSDKVRMGYFNQHQMDILDDDASPLDMMKRLAPNETEAVLRTFLGSFDFRGDRVNTVSQSFSGGERARLTLALIVWQRPNILILDEPTNHLDLQMRQALTIALQSFEGAVVLVSHDREMIANVCDQLYLVADGTVTEFDGDLDDYSKWLKDSRKSAQQAEKNAKPKEQTTHNTNAQAATQTAQTKPVENTLSKEAQRKLKAEQRALTAPIRKRLEQAEKQLDTLASQLATIETQLADSSLYEAQRKADFLNLLEEQKKLQQQHDECEEEMLVAMEELEDFSS